MADEVDKQAEASAEKAYAAASDTVGQKPEEAAGAAAPSAVVAEPVAAARAAPAKPAARAAARKAAPAPKPAPKQSRAKPVRPPRPAVTARPEPAVPSKVKPRIPPKSPISAKRKETLMEFSNDYAESLKKVVSEAQEKAASAFEKGSSMLGEYTDFAKGNVEALVESGKILGAGLQEMGSAMLTEGKAAVETLSSDAKALSSVKSPTDFFKLQSEIARRNFDAAVALGSRNSEAMLKLASDVVAPISGRLSLAVEKVKQAA